MKRSLYILLICGSSFFGSVMTVRASAGPGSSPRSILKPDTAFVSCKMARVFDLDFRDHQYTVDLLLYISVDSSVKCDFGKELKVYDAKDCAPGVISAVTSGRNIVTRISLKAVIFQAFEVQNYPFDGQHLKLRLYDAACNAGKLVFRIGEKMARPVDLNNRLEDGWTIHKLVDTAFASDPDITGDKRNMFSSVILDIDMHRDHSASLFLKLFTGMYIAFLIAFASLFIDVKATESRFALLVGGLFGAIGNKYVTESQLPQSPQFCMADWLHTMSIFFIFLIVVSSVVSLRLRADRFKWITPAVILGVYLAINFICIHWAVLHEGLLDASL